MARDATRPDPCAGNCGHAALTNRDRGGSAMARTLSIQFFAIDLPNGLVVTTGPVHQTLPCAAPRAPGIGDVSRSSRPRGDAPFLQNRWIPAQLMLPVS